MPGATPTRRVHRLCDAQVHAAAQWASQNAAAHQQREAGLRQQAAAMRGEYESLRQQVM